jgi:serine O-acetyltransferase
MVRAPSLVLRAGSAVDLARYVAKQLESLFPAEGLEADTERLSALLPSALERLRPILASVRNFDPTTFNHFNSLQYATFLYLLSNEQWRCSPSDAMADRLFCLNRALNAIDLFFAVQMPEIFFISHGLGSVIGNATYGERLVTFQNVTVGRVGDDRPQVGARVVLYPGAVVTGRAIIGEGSVVAAGTVVHGITVPPDVVVTSLGGEIVFRPRTRDFISLYFRPTI